MNEWTNNVVGLCFMRFVKKMISLFLFSFFFFFKKKPPSPPLRFSCWYIINSIWRPRTRHCARPGGNARCREDAVGQGRRELAKRLFQGGSHYEVCCCWLFVFVGCWLFGVVEVCCCWLLVVGCLLLLKFVVVVVVVHTFLYFSRLLTHSPMLEQSMDRTTSSACSVCAPKKSRFWWSWSWCLAAISRLCCVTLDQRCDS